MSRFFIVACFMLVPNFAFAQAPAVPWANKLFLAGIDRNPRQVAPPVVTHDFGTVPHGTLCVHKFTITNIYDAPLQVLDWRKSCGCLEAYPPQKVLQPNEQAEFVVTMNAGKFTGQNAQTLYVTVGPTYLSTAIIRLSANSRTDVQLNPGQVNFGMVAPGSKPTQTVTLEYTGRQRDWKLTGYVPPTGPIDVDVKEASRGVLGIGGSKYTIAVTLKAEAPAGPVSEIISLRTNDPAAPIVQVNVAGMVEAPLTLSTTMVKFDKVKVGEESSQRVIVRAAAGPFRIQPVPDEGDGVIVETFPAAAPTQIVTIKFQPTKAGMVRKEVKLKTDLRGATATIVVEGEGQ